MTSIIGTNSIFNQYKKIEGMGMGPKKENSFGEVLTESLKKAADSTRQNEKLAQKKVFDEVDLTALTTDTAQLDVMISTISGLRDKVISAIQELQKMQI